MGQAVAFLRAVNVSGRNTLRMVELREVLQSRGFNSVSTVAQSGNVLLSAADQAPEEIEAELENLIQARFGYDITVILRTREELSAIIERAPWTASNDGQYAVLMLKTLPREFGSPVELLRRSSDSFHIRGRNIYLCYAEGLHRTPYTPAFFERHLKVSATLRNWSMIQRIVGRFPTFPTP